MCGLLLKPSMPKCDRQMDGHPHDREGILTCLPAYACDIINNERMSCLHLNNLHRQKLVSTLILKICLCTTVLCKNIAEIQIYLLNINNLHTRNTEELARLQTTIAA